MAMSVETLARRSRKDRFKLQQLIDSGMTEGAALAEVFPKDSNRSKKLKTWREKGLFPIPDSEREANGTTVKPTDTTAQDAARGALDTGLPPKTTVTTVSKPEPEPSPSEAPQSVVPVVLATTVPESPEEDLEKIWDLMAERVNAAAAKVVEARLSALTEGFQAAEKRPPGPGRYYKGGKTHAKINVSIPKELNEALLSLGGNRSQHVTNAIKLYLEFQNSTTDATKE